jgi:chromosomal replication initiation ATPase DnaA
MKQIIREVINDCDLTIGDLKEPGRSQPKTRCRQWAMVQLYKEGYGPKKIGDFFNRDKSTVNYAVRKLGE